MGNIYNVYSEETALVYSEMHGNNLCMPFGAGLRGNSEMQCVKIRMVSAKSVLYGVV